MTGELQTVGFWITCAQAALLIIYCAVLRLVSHHPCDGLLALASWPTSVRECLPFILVVLLAIPVLIFAFSNAAGAILAWLEGWNFMDGFEYVIGNMQSIGPLNNLVPTSRSGQFFDALVSIISMVFCASVMGFCTQMRVVSFAGRLLSGSWMNSFCTLGIIMVSIFLLCLVFAFALVAVEDVELLDVFFFMVSQIAGIQNSLGSAGPQTHMGYFFEGLATVVALSVGGAIVGVLGGDPAVLRLVDWVEGPDPVQETEEAPKSVIPAEAKDLEREDLERKVEELQGRILEMRMHYEAHRHLGRSLLEAEEALSQAHAENEQLREALRNAHAQETQEEDIPPGASKKIEDEKQFWRAKALDLQATLSATLKAARDGDSSTSLYTALNYGSLLPSSSLLPVPVALDLSDGNVIR